MLRENLFRFAVVAVLGAVFALVSSALVATDQSTAVQTAEIQEVPETGIFFNRPNREPRTQPVDPGVPVGPAPSFEAPPSDGIPVAAAPAALSPEQKEQLKGIIAQLIPLILGAFLGSGSASPFIKLILEKLLGAVGGPTTPVSTRRTRAKKKAVSVKP